MEIQAISLYEYRPLLEALFLEQAWQGYRARNEEQTGQRLADVRANRRRFYTYLNLTLDGLLRAQAN